ncbi:unnamed protein product, partial [Discosporangium mesarthrocarpum]
MALALVGGILVQCSNLKASALRAATRAGSSGIRRVMICSKASGQVTWRLQGSPTAPWYGVSPVALCCANCWKGATRSFHATPAAERRDPYEVLGVQRSATQAEIKRRYLELAKKYHPDTNRRDPTAAEKFKEASEAYELLKNSQRRQEYDAYGNAGQGAGGG